MGKLICQIGATSMETNTDAQFILDSYARTRYVSCATWGGKGFGKGYMETILWGVNWDTVSCYQKYVNTVGGMRHAEKWNEYKSHLNSWEYLGFNYIVHY